MKRLIGLHMRLARSFTDLAQKAVRLNLDTFQCFFIVQESGKLLEITDDDLQQFLQIRRAHFDQIYAHGSYWINLASVQFAKHYSLKHELEYAKRLEFNALILHAGSAKGAAAKSEGIQAVARILNKTFKTENSVRIILENAAHDNLSVGGDLQDFFQLLQLLDHPEKLTFCLDTAHAHSYGYNLLDVQGQQKFMDVIENTIGFDKVELIHLNDTAESLGSRVDKHAAIGDGLLGDAALPLFVTHKQLRDVPIILELPAIAQEKEIEIVDMVRGWCAK